MPTSEISGARIATQANVYFDGKCVSHALVMPDGSRKSVGVVLPAQLTFSTAAPEIMECVAGECSYKLAGTDEWRTCKAGERFTIAGNSAFDIRVNTSFHYICHYG